MDVEGSSCALIQNIAPAITCRDWSKPWKTSIKQKPSSFSCCWNGTQSCSPCIWSWYKGHWCSEVGCDICPIKADLSRSSRQTVELFDPSVIKWLICPTWTWLQFHGTVCITAVFNLWSSVTSQLTFVLPCLTLLVCLAYSLTLKTKPKMFFQNASKSPPGYMASHSRRQYSTNIMFLKLILPTSLNDLLLYTQLHFTYFILTVTAWTESETLQILNKYHQNHFRSTTVEMQN
jgi:hypothetical protein